MPNNVFGSVSYLTLSQRLVPPPAGLKDILVRNSTQPNASMQNLRLKQYYECKRDESIWVSDRPERDTPLGIPTGSFDSYFGYVDASGPVQVAPSSGADRNHVWASIAAPCSLWSLLVFWIRLQLFLSSPLRGDPLKEVTKYLFPVPCCPRAAPPSSSPSGAFRNAKCAMLTMHSACQLRPSAKC